MNARFRLERKGQKAGYRAGRSYGYHLGRCQAAVEQAESTGRVPRQCRVMYVATGLGVPYAAIDQAVSAALARTVAHTASVFPDEHAATALEQFRPDLLLTVHGANLPKDILQKARELGAKTALWWADDPYHHDLARQIAPHYDYVFTNEASCVALYCQLGCAQAACLPLGADQQIFHPRRVGPFEFVDVCFIGSAFANRAAFIDKIASYLAGKKVLIAGYWWERLKHYEMLKKSILPRWLDPDETAFCYNRAKIVINLHRAQDDPMERPDGGLCSAVSVNPRTFEIAACGALQLTDIRGELSSVYVPGEELATYESPEDLIAKAEYYLQNEQERSRIALSGLIRTRSDHTYDRRIFALLDAVFGSE